MARDLIKILVDAKQVVPQQLKDMAAYGGGGGGGGEFIFHRSSLHLTDGCMTNQYTVDEVEAEEVDTEEEGGGNFACYVHFAMFKPKNPYPSSITPRSYPVSTSHYSPVSYLHPKD
jgi:hypothetical protein